MISVTFPDGAQRQFAPGTTGLDIARGISPSLAKRTVAMALDGALADLADEEVPPANLAAVSLKHDRSLGWQGLGFVPVVLHHRAVDHELVVEPNPGGRANLYLCSRAEHQIAEDHAAGMGQRHHCGDGRDRL